MNGASASILAFHGGGFLGYFSACVADRLQERRKALGATGPLRDSFDVICGTSVGAILAAAVATGTPTATVLQVMQEQGETIFPPRRFGRKSPGIFAARFSQAPLRRLIEDVLGSVCLGELDRILIIPAINESRGEPVIFRSTDPEHHGLRLADVVLASAAAPLYLPLHRINGERYADGGLVANSPSLIASADITRIFDIAPARQSVISIGTTRIRASSSVPSCRSDAWGGVRWIWGGGRLQQIMMNGQERLQEDLLDGLGPAVRVHLDMELDADAAEKVHLVCADRAAKAILEGAAEACTDRVSPAQRGALDRCLARRARALAWWRVRGRPAPVLRPTHLLD
ncbi:MAG: CBASS cGAMP-activated phospholipase [Alkalilacustris sp.]